MKKQWLVLVLLLSVMSVCAYAASLGTYAFPQKGQTPEQQKTDENACAQWASDQTGLNPAVLEYQQKEAMAAQQQAVQQQQKAASTGTIRRIGRAALTGAALGGIDNGMDDGAGKGAVMGLTAATSQSIAKSKEQKIQAGIDSADAQSQQVQADTQKYLRAFSACMEGKGYSIR